MVYIKICGITNLEDARVAVEAGADMLGFIFYPKSPRYVSPEHAYEIVHAIRSSLLTPRFVGVFVNESSERAREVVELAQLDLAQLHGDEPAAMVRVLNETRRVFRNPSGLTTFGACKALRPRDAVEAYTAIEEYRTAVNGNAPAFIVDAFDAKQFGGTGARGDWNIAADIARAFPILLAGGLNAENVADAIRVIAPWGVDVSSGVERAPGLKDHAKVREFVQAVRSAH